MNNLPLWILRTCFLIVAIGLGVSLVNGSMGNEEAADGDRIAIWVIFGIFLFGSVGTIVALSLIHI